MQSFSKISFRQAIVCLGRENPLLYQSLCINDLNLLCRFSLERMSAEYGYELNKPSRLVIYGFSTSARFYGGFCFMCNKIKRS